MPDLASLTILITFLYKTWKYCIKWPFLTISGHLSKLSESWPKDTWEVGTIVHILLIQWVLFLHKIMCKFLMYSVCSVAFPLKYTFSLVCYCFNHGLEPIYWQNFFNMMTFCACCTHNNASVMITRGVSTGRRGSSTWIIYFRLKSIFTRTFCLIFVIGKWMSCSPSHEIISISHIYIPLKL